MSKELEQIEALAYANIIRDTADIHRIMCALLNLTLEELAASVKIFPDLLVGEIADGFLLDAEKVRKLTIREILILIGYMPSARYFELNYKEPWEAVVFLEEGDTFGCAHACFYLSEILYNAARFNITVKQFMHISYPSLMWYLEGMKDVKNKTDPKSRPKCHVSTVPSKIEVRTLEFLDPPPIKGGARINNSTVGDVLEVINKKGLTPWMCDLIPLLKFAGKIINTYRISLNLFMDSIRKNLIDSNRDDFWKILNKCCETEKYLFPKRFTFNNYCYE